MEYYIISISIFKSVYDSDDDIDERFMAPVGLVGLIEAKFIERGQWQA